MSKAVFNVEFSVTEVGRKRPEYTLETDVNGEISLLDFLTFTKSSLMITADTVLREEQAKGFDKNPVVVVDGSPNKPVIGVSPFGTLEFVDRTSMDTIIQETYDGIQYRSPVLEGVYKNSNYVFHNGVQVATSPATLEAWLKSGPQFKPNDLIRFVNIQPYARKLERLGVTGNRPARLRKTTSKSKKSGAVRIRLNQPNGTYYLTSRAIRSKYKRTTSIRFSFISGSHLGLAASFGPHKVTGKPGRPYLYPTITIAIQENGSV